MSASEVLSYLLGGTGCLVLALIVAFMFSTGRWHSDAEFRKAVERGDKLEAALDAERKAINEYAQTGNTTNQLLAAITTMAKANAARGE